MTEHELSVGSSRSIRAIKRRYPDLSDKEPERLLSIVVDEVGKRIGRGEQIAFLRTNPDGTAELTVLGLEILNKKEK